MRRIWFLSLIILLKSFSLVAGDDSFDGQMISLRCMGGDEETDEKDSVRKKLAGIWGDVDAETAARSMGDIGKELFDQMIQTKQIKSRCLITRSTPIYFNNISDFNLLVETAESIDGKSVRIKRVVSSLSREIFYSNFYQSRFTISTQNKETRDIEWQKILTNRKGVAYQGKLPKDEAEIKAILLAAELKSKRAASGLFEIVFQPSRFFDDFEDSIDRCGLEILVENHPSVTHQVLISIQESRDWRAKNAESDVKISVGPSNRVDTEIVDFDNNVILANDLYKLACILHYLRVKKGYFSSEKTQYENFKKMICSCFDPDDSIWKLFQEHVMQNCFGKVEIVDGDKYEHPGSYLPRDRLFLASLLLKSQKAELMQGFNEVRAMLPDLLKIEIKDNYDEDLRDELIATIAHIKQAAGGNAL